MDTLSSWGVEDADHPAAAIDRDRIRDKMGLGEWYIRTGNRAEEEDLMRRVNQEIDHDRLPAYLILGSHPTETREGLVIYLDGIGNEAAAWRVLEETVEEMRHLTSGDDALDLSSLADHLTSERALLAMAIGSDAIAYIQFIQ